MSAVSWSVRRLQGIDGRRLDELADVLIDCVDGGASVSFMQPLSRERAIAFWKKVADEVAVAKRALLVAEDSSGICGTVQLVLDQPENQPHRADLAKMLVHRRARRQELGAELMRAAEKTARECGKTLLVLDAVTTGDAARLYERLGWVRVGDIPDYALFPQGGLCSTTVFYRRLGSERTLKVERGSPRDPNVVRMITALDAYVAELYPPESNHLLDIEALCAPDVRFFVARLDGEVVGCGALRLDPAGYGELKRMFVGPHARGKHVGRAILLRLEQEAGEAKLPCVRLETGTRQAEALGLYRSAGYREIPPFGDYQPDPLSVFMEKDV